MTEEAGKASGIEKFDGTNFAYWMKGACAFHMTCLSESKRVIFILKLPKPLPPSFPPIIRFSSQALESQSHKADAS